MKAVVQKTYYGLTELCMLTFGNMTQSQVKPNCQTFSTSNVALIDEFLENDAIITRLAAQNTVIH